MYGALVGLEYEGYLGDLLVFDYKKNKKCKMLCESHSNQVWSKHEQTQFAW